MSETTPTKKGRPWWKYLLVLVFFPIAAPYYIWKRKHWNVIIRIFLILLVWFISLIVFTATQISEEDLKEQAEVGTNRARVIRGEITPEPTVEPTKIPPTEKPKQKQPTAQPTKKPASFVNSTLTTDSVKAEIAKIKGVMTYTNKDLKEIKITEDGNYFDKPQDQMRYIVTIIYDPATIHPKAVVRSTSNSMMQASEMLFKHPKVSIVRVNTVTKFVDEYGKEFDGDAMRLGIEKDTADKIDWENMKEMVEIDYKKAFTIADEKYLSPAIAKDL